MVKFYVLKARTCVLSLARGVSRVHGAPGPPAPENVSAGIPLNLVQKWLGHAQLSTTAIYADAVGEEEQSIASRMW